MPLTKPVREILLKPRATSHASPESLEAAARAALADAAYDPVRRVQCTVRDGAAVLSGRVATFYLKQIAQSVVAQRLRGAVKIENRIEVAAPV